MGFSLILLPVMFISYYTNIYFFVKNFFSNVYISVNTIFKCSYLSFGWEIGRSLGMYVTREMEGSHPKFLQICTGGEGYHASCISTNLHLFSYICLMVSRFMCTYELTLSLSYFFLMVSCFICRNLTLPSFKKSVFVRNGYFSPMRSTSVVMK